MYLEGKFNTYKKEYKMIMWHNFVLRNENILNFSAEISVHIKYLYIIYNIFILKLLSKIKYINAFLHNVFYIRILPWSYF